MTPKNKKIMVSRVLTELEGILHRAIDQDRVGNLNVFEMIMVSADTLDKTYRARKKSKEKKNELAQVIEFKRK